MHNLSATKLMIYSGLVSLSLMALTSPAFARSNNAADKKPSTTTTTTTTTTPNVVGPTQSANLATNSFTVGFADLGKIFRVNFDGNVGTQAVSGLSSFVDFTFQGFETVTGNTIAKFKAVLDDTSSGGITSRVTGLGFNTSSTLLSAGATGLFDDAHLNGAFPNQFGNVDVCFNAGNTCQGGGNGGISTASGTGEFNFSLTLAGAVNSLTLNNLGVRYQSIAGTALGTSGTGSATSVAVVPATPPAPPETPLFDQPINGTTPPDAPDAPTAPPTPATPPTPLTPKPTKVPEPGMVAALGLVSAIAVRYRKQRESNA